MKLGGTGNRDSPHGTGGPVDAGKAAVLLCTATAEHLGMGLNPRACNRGLQDQSLQAARADNGTSCVPAGVCAHGNPTPTWWNIKSTTFVSSSANVGSSHEGCCSTTSPSSSPSCWLAAAAGAAAAAAAAARGPHAAAQPAGAAARPARRFCRVGARRPHAALPRSCSCERLELRLAWSCCSGLLAAAVDI